MVFNNIECVNELNKIFELPLPQKMGWADFEKLLSAYLNQLIKTDFEKLVYLLYRIDVSEKKLKELLKNQPHEDAGKIIAQLIIERQLQKIKSRKKNTRQSNLDDEFEKW